MANRLQIVNTALRSLSRDPISSFEDGTSEANLINDIYDMTVEQVMIVAAWVCLRKRSTLVASADKPEFGFSNSFLLPTDYPVIQIIEFNKQQIFEGSVSYTGPDSYLGITGAPNYQVEGDRLLTDSSYADIVYIAKDTNEANWDVHLANTVVAALKVAISDNVGASASKTQQLQRELERLGRINRARNTQQASPEKFRTTQYLEGR